MQALATGIDHHRYRKLRLLENRPLLVLRLLIHLDQDMPEHRYAGIRSALV